MGTDALRLNRLDLADILGPARLAAALHQQIGPLDGPVPVEDIARALDIVDICRGSYDGFEGMLLTDKVRSRGGILANTSRGHQRARFTVAHELGHFLLERHVLTSDEGFQCRALDMREDRQKTIGQRQEAEANRFSIELLAPPQSARRYCGGAPDLKDAHRIRDALDISMEAAVRRLVDLHPEPVAAVFSKNGQIGYVVKNETFPWINRGRGDRVAPVSVTAKALRKGSSGYSDLVEVPAIAWTSNADVEVMEQVRLASEGRAITLLVCNAAETDDEDGNGTIDLTVPGFR